MIGLSKKYKFQHYIFIYLLIQFTLVPFWSGYRITLAILVLIAFVFYYHKHRSIKVDNKLLIIFFIYSVIAFIQGLIWGFSFISIISSFAFSFLLAYLIYKTYSLDFLLLFEKVFKFFTVISMIIWAIQNLMPGITELLNSYISFLNEYSSDVWPRSMLIYTYWDGLSVSNYIFTRNAGFLHEPGGFSVLIILAIIINYAKGITLFDRRNYIYLAAMVSTVSTAGYLSLAFMFMLLIRQNKQRVFSLFVLPFLIAGAIYSYNTFSFMQAKIENQVNEQTAKSLNQGASGRIFGARKSLFVLTKYPLYGRGLNSITLPDYDSPEFAGYGWISFISKLGLIFGALFLYYFFKGIYNITKVSGFGFFEFIIFSIAIMTNLSSQGFIGLPLFLFFFFVGLYHIRNLKFYFLKADRSITKTLKENY